MFTKTGRLLAVAAIALAARLHSRRNCATAMWAPKETSRPDTQ